jgi:hypothetical protein
MAADEGLGCVRHRPWLRPLCLVKIGEPRDRVEKAVLILEELRLAISVDRNIVQVGTTRPVSRLVAYQDGVT